MAQKLFRKVIDELAILKPEIVMLHYGGESLLHPLFKDFLFYARTLLPATQLGWQDNGILFTPEIARLAVLLKVDFVGFSIDNFARSGSIEQNINYLHSIARSKLEIRINITQSTQSKKEISALINHWRSKADEITVNPCLTRRLHIINPEEWKLNAPKFCKQPFKVLGIFHNGNVVPCCTDIQGQNIIGNISKHTIMQVWHSPRLWQLRSQCFFNKFPTKAICKECEAWQTKTIYAHKTAIVSGEKRDREETSVYKYR